MRKRPRGNGLHRALVIVALFAVGGMLLTIRTQAQQKTASVAEQAKNASKSKSSSQGKDPDAGLLQRKLASIHIQSSLVVAPVTVMNRSGNLVDDLSKSDFLVYDNGVRQRISLFSQALEPVALVVLVQNNYSVEPLLNQVRPLGPEFSGLLVGAKGAAALVEFSDKSKVLQPFTNSPAALDAAFKKIEATGTKARLNDALAYAILMLSQRPLDQKRVIVVFSEGFDHGSETHKQEIIQAASDADVTIFGLRFDPTQVLLDRKDSIYRPTPIYNSMGLPGVPGQPNTPANSEIYNNPAYVNPIDLGAKTVTAARSMHRIHKVKSLMDHYCSVTGGIMYSHWSERGLQNQLQRIADEVNNQYVLAYVPSTIRQTGFHQIQVQVLIPNVVVRTRAGYFSGVTTAAQTKTASAVKSTVKTKKLKHTRTP